MAGVVSGAGLGHLLPCLLLLLLLWSASPAQTQLPTGQAMAICPPGHSLANGRCTDDDECTNTTHPVCGSLPCSNTLGSYYCRCPVGLTAFRGFCHPILTDWITSTQPAAIRTPGVKATTTASSTAATTTAFPVTTMASAQERKGQTHTGLLIALIVFVVAVLALMLYLYLTTRKEDSWLKRKFTGKEGLVDPDSRRSSGTPRNTFTIDGDLERLAPSHRPSFTSSEDDMPRGSVVSQLPMLRTDQQAYGRDANSLFSPEAARHQAGGLNPGGAGPRGGEQGPDTWQAGPEDKTFGTRLGSVGCLEKLGGQGTGGGRSASTSDQIAYTDGGDVNAFRRPMQAAAVGGCDAATYGSHTQTIAGSYVDGGNGGGAQARDRLQVGDRYQGTATEYHTITGSQMPGQSASLTCDQYDTTHDLQVQIADMQPLPQLGDAAAGIGGQNGASGSSSLAYESAGNMHQQAASVASTDVRGSGLSGSQLSPRLGDDAAGTIRQDGINGLLSPAEFGGILLQADGSTGPHAVDQIQSNSGDHSGMMSDNLEDNLYDTAVSAGLEGRGGNRQSFSASVGRRESTQLPAASTDHIAGLGSGDIGLDTGGRQGLMPAGMVKTSDYFSKDTPGCSTTSTGLESMEGKSGSQKTFHKSVARKVSSKLPAGSSARMASEDDFGFDGVGAEGFGSHESEYSQSGPAAFIDDEDKADVLSNYGNWDEEGEVGESATANGLGAKSKGALARLGMGLAKRVMGKKPAESSQGRQGDSIEDGIANNGDSPAQKATRQEASTGTPAASAPATEEEEVVDDTYMYMDAAQIAAMRSQMAVKRNVVRVESSTSLAEEDTDQPTPKEGHKGVVWTMTLKKKPSMRR